MNDAVGPAVWTGRALIAVNSTTTDVSGILPGDGGAFNVRADRWYGLQRPVNGFLGGELQLVWTGRELLLPDIFVGTAQPAGHTFVLGQGGLELGP